ncbi:hypothetical protein QC762_0007000 [Podospora pseudocomata]|uniref:Uncharacterized protein n=1 Tax=Podospora pseudocomata TaxID=2093779 RepID=A0ABR0GU34_9PEZI|nr:hypothetical protein QC762_0007000 [Podospora pseudocomata]
MTLGPFQINAQSDHVGEAHLLSWEFGSTTLKNLFGALTLLLPKIGLHRGRSQPPSSQNAKAGYSCLSDNIPKE